MMYWPSELQDAMVRVTFSRWCISALVPDCACKRCLIKAGKTWNERTERAAEERSKLETKKFYERTGRS